MNNNRFTKYGATLAVVASEGGSVKQEEWLPIPGWEGLYEVSDMGKVRRFGCDHLRKLQTGRKGYRAVMLYKKGAKCRLRAVHRMVAEAFIGPIPDGMVINHRDANRANNAIGNLEVCTPLQNCRHAAEVFQRWTGEANPSVKITAEDAVEIFALAVSGSVTQKEIARQYGVSIQLVSAIKLGLAWSSATGQTRRFRASRAALPCSPATA